jgi:hypothetical protein
VSRRLGRTSTQFFWTKTCMCPDWLGQYLSLCTGDPEEFVSSKPKEQFQSFYLNAPEEWLPFPLPQFTWRVGRNEYPSPNSLKSGFDKKKPSITWRVGKNIFFIDTKVKPIC